MLRVTRVHVRRRLVAANQRCLLRVLHVDALLPRQILARERSSLAVELHATPNDLVAALSRAGRIVCVVVLDEVVLKVLSAHVELSMALAAGRDLRA